MLFHRFQKGRLRLARGTVDLVGQQEIGHDRAGLVDELPAVLVIDRKADDVRGDGVGDELDSPGLQPQDLGKGHGRGGLAHPGDVLHEDMPPGQDGHEDLFHRFGLAHHDLLDLVQDALGGFAVFAHKGAPSARKCGRVRYFSVFSRFISGYFRKKGLIPHLPAGRRRNRRALPGPPGRDRDPGAGDRARG